MRAFVGGLVVALSLAPALAAPASPAVQAPKPAVPVATHATSGIVRSVSASALQISRTAKDSKTIMFVLTADTKTTGTVAVGGRVEVRYRTEKGRNVATAITVRLPKSGL